jgi:hypothetical protein
MGPQSLLRYIITCARPLQLVSPRIAFNPDLSNATKEWKVANGFTARAWARLPFAARLLTNLDEVQS